MKPSTPELLEGIAGALERNVLPHVQDKWAASTLRSAVQLLAHLALRVDLEPKLLAVEWTELEPLIGGTARSLHGTTAASLASDLESVLGLPQPPVHDVEALAARDEAGLAALERVLAAREDIRRATGSDELHRTIVDYLQRRLARGKPLVLPAFLGPPF